MLQKIRNSYLARRLVVYLSISMIFQNWVPNQAFGLTSGPSQPEVQSFTPVSATEMVDLTSGDFQYNIPLLDAGGYPINLSYSSGVTMDQEASWVGLGWNVNPGVINHGMRGLSDDWNGSSELGDQADMVTNETYMKPNRTFGISLGLQPEIFGKDAGKKLGKLIQKLGKINYSLGVNFNNYNGVDISQNGSFNIDKLNMNLGLQTGQAGLTISPSIGLGGRVEYSDDEDAKMGRSIGISINSRQGLTSVNLNATGAITCSDTRKGQSSYGSIGYSFTPQTYTPQFKNEYSSLDFSFRAQTGPTLFGIDVSGSVRLSYSRQKLKNNGEPEKIPAFGYLNAHEADGNSLMDFNREKDAGFSSATTNLPLTNSTFDVYGISGQGVGGMFRPFRSDLGHVHDNYSYSDGATGNLALEFDAGNLAELGTDIKINPSYSESGDWRQDNLASRAFNYTGPISNDLYEPSYFKQSGELTVDDEGDFFTNLGGYKPLHIPIKKAGGWKVETENLGLPNNYRRQKRVKRNQLISYLNKGEVDAGYGVGGYTDLAAKDHHIAEISVTKTDGMRYIYGVASYNKKQEDVTFAIAKEENYIEGDCESGLVPYDPDIDVKAKNGNGRDEYFNRSTKPAYAHSYLLSEVLSPDYQDINNNGVDDADLGGFVRFDYKTISDYKWRVPYSHESANFNQGLGSIKSDDKANYIYGEKDLKYLDKIFTQNYVTIFHTSDRLDGYDVVDENGGRGDTPMKKLDRISLYSKSDWNKNYNSETPNDYSELIPIKEVHFEYSYDLCPGVPNNRIETATYDPDEDLETNNDKVNEGGKLTLKRVYFTYQKSNRARYNAYNFDYNSHNPEYNLKGYDVWGCYKPNMKTYNEEVLGAEPLLSCDPHSPDFRMSNPEFPYVEQNQESADLYTSAWTMTDIGLPSGGSIHVKYESDDYRFVQDRQAMEMFKVLGVTGFIHPDATQIGKNLLFNGEDLTKTKLIFEIPDTTQLSPKEFYDKYVREIFTEYKGLLQFRFLTKIKDDHQYDYVPGYVELEPFPSSLEDEYYGTFYDSNNNRWCGYVRVKEVPIRDNNTGDLESPIAKAGWAFTRMNLPKIAFGLPDNFKDEDESGQALKNITKTLAQASFIKQVIDFAKDPNTKMRDKEYCQAFIPEKSWIRLMNGKGTKLGGGCRVAQIQVNDHWNEMVGNNAGENFTSGQVYRYVGEDGLSSGVATYEPIQGRDNPFVQPDFQTVRHLLAPDDRHYVEQPYGESFFPGPAVTYGRVEVSSPPFKSDGTKLNEDINGIPILTSTITGTGKVIQEYYTTRDYPTIVKATRLKPIRRSLLGMIKIGISKDFVTASQAYTIITNDMNGKAKAMWVLPEGENKIAKAISGVEYNYDSQVRKTGTLVRPVDDITDKMRDLTRISSRKGKYDNKCVVIYPDGSVKTRTIGIDFETTADFRHSESSSTSVGANAGLSTFLAAFFPGIVPTIWPTFSQHTTRFRSAVTTKIIHRSGILREVVAHDLGASISTRNLAWDSETGNVLLTGTTNEYGDDLYSFNYPAHWGYDEMGQAYQNQGLLMDNLSMTDGVISVANPENLKFVLGDELRLRYANSDYKAWVTEITKGTSGSITIMDSDGIVPSGFENGVRLKVIRSGRKNMQSVAIGSLTLKKSPIQTENNEGVVTYKSLFETIENAGFDARVLAAGSVEFSDDWPTDCACGLNPESDIYNPYVRNERGQWRAKRSYLYLGENDGSGNYISTRDQQNSGVYGVLSNEEMDSREDGVFSTFDPFWKSPQTAGDHWNMNDANWTWSQQTTRFNQWGLGLESQDRLGIYSAVQFDYNNNLPTAVSANARYSEIGFDGFEDYDFDTCEDDHFSFEKSLPGADKGPQGGWWPTDIKITDEESHTGRKSIKVGGGRQATLTKKIIKCDE